MRYELSRYTLYTHERIYSKEFKIQCVATNILFMYTCFPVHRQYLLERAPTKLKVKKIRNVHTSAQEEKEAAYRNSKKLLLKKFRTADFPNWQKKNDDTAAEDINQSFSKTLTLIS